MKKVLSGFVSAVLLLAIIFVGCQFFFSETTSDLLASRNHIRRSDLKKIQPGAVVDVSSLSDIRSGTMCLMGPYSSVVDASEGSAAASINEHLKANGIRMG